VVLVNFDLDGMVVSVLVQYLKCLCSLEEFFMRQAKSMYLAGSLMQADRCDYRSCIDFGLVCPFCNDPVFLVGESTRRKNGSTETIRAHFSHFKADANRGKDCEARSLTKEGRDYLQKLSPLARGQRLKLFNRRLWDMIREGKNIPKNLDRRIRAKLPRQAIEQIPDVIKHCRNHWNDDRNGLESFLRRSVKALVVESARPQIPVDLNQSVVPLFNQMRDELDTNLQYAIAAEVVDYLGTAPASGCFNDLIKVAILDAYELEQISQNHRFSTSLVHRMAVSTIAITSWEKVLLKFSKPQPGEGFKRH
jgi:hypothetical protein